MSGYLQNIKKITLTNDYFRQVLFTDQHMQLVVMSLVPDEEIGLEIHEIVTQFFRIESGEGKVIIGGEAHPITDGDAFVISAGVEHNVINTSAKEPLRLYTIYSPPHHKFDAVHKTKLEAEADVADHL